MKKINNGFSLLEIILVLAIAASLIIGAFLIFPKVQMAQKIHKESQNLSIIQNGIRNLYASQPNYTGLTTSMLVDGNIIPDDMVLDSSSTPLNSFKGNVTLILSPLSPSGGVNSAFGIRYFNVPLEACIKLISEVHPNFFVILVGGTTVKNGLTGIPFDQATVSSACKNSSTSFINFISN